MKDFLSKTFGGLRKEYYFRQLLFGLFFFGSMTWAIVQIENVDWILYVVAFAVLTLLYPYSRYVYESVVGFIFEENVFLAGGAFLIITLWLKVTMMAMCWILSVFIAPFGLLHLYWFHSRLES